MFFWRWKGKDHNPTKKTVGGDTRISKGGSKNLAKKGNKGYIGKLSGKKPSNTERENVYLNALSRFIDAAADFGQIDKPDEAFVNFGSADIEDGTWHVTRVPEGPQTHLVLAKSEPHTGTDFLRNSSNTLVEQIYRDLHEVSFNGLTRHTTDLNPQLPQGNNASLADLNRYSIQSSLANRTKEMLSVIENARLHQQYEALGKRCEQQFVHDSEAAVHTLRNAPDQHRRVESLAFRETRKRTRYGTFATDHGWMMLSILANSVAFRYACHALDNDSWVDLNLTIADNARSIEMFAKVRGLNWRAALTKEPYVGAPLTDLEIRSTLNVPTDHPHNWSLPQEGDPQRPRDQGHDQINVPANIYNPAILASGPRPADWPPGLRFPSDPTIRRSSEGPCHRCESHSICTCSIETSILHPLVELTTYPGRGNGVRALQAIPEGAVIGEYVGEIYPLDSEGDPTYNLEFRGTDGPLCQIHCTRYGNWTRYMNHSCNPAAFFYPLTIGNRLRMCVQVIREIGIFEEITIDYGTNYWQENHLCRCGEPDCKYDTVEKIRALRADDTDIARQEFVANPDEV
ncbi:MAG: hypothetical protein M1830_009451 [Pleopsidium flavum]|nr:MAG: hypothetical protein M1830_009451 [Pleopsidium flavum]